MSELNMNEVVEVAEAVSESVDKQPELESTVEGVSLAETQADAVVEESPEVGEIGEGWQQRAEEAEARLVAVAEQLGEVEQTARELHEAIEVQRVGRLLDVELLRAGVSDLDAARRAVMHQLESTQSAGSGDSIEVEVGRLVTERPGLFAGESGVGGRIGGMGGVMRSRASGAQVEADRAADVARSSGDRRQLLRYLRLRRVSE